MSITSLDDEHSLITCTKAINFVLTAASANAYLHKHIFLVIILCSTMKNPTPWYRAIPKQPLSFQLLKKLPYIPHIQHPQHKTPAEDQILINFNSYPQNLHCEDTV
jgi:hypothetical protein